MEPLAGEVVHAAGAHQRQHPDGDVVGERLTAGEGIAALAGQRGGHHRQIAAGDGDGALAEIEVEGGFRIGLDDVEVAQQVADGPVAVAGLLLREVDGLVDRQPPTGQFLEIIQQQLHRTVGIGIADLGRSGDGPGIDHGIARLARFRVQADGIEGLSGRLHIDLARHEIERQHLQRKRVDEWLGDRLNREFLPRVADLVDPPTRGGDDDAEIVAACLGQLGNVIRHPALLEVAEGGVELFEQFLDHIGMAIGSVERRGMAQRWTQSPGVEGVSHRSE